MLAGSFCAETCGYCEEECLELQPTEQKTCSQEANEGNCDEVVAQGFCKQTCGVCPGEPAPPPTPTPVTTVEEATVSTPTVRPAPTPTPSPTPSPSSPSPSVDGQMEGEICTDVAPAGEYTCAQQKDFGKCNSSWMVDGGFCNETCGRCGAMTKTGEKGDGEGECKCDCDCGCGCCGQQNAELMGQVVADAIKQVLTELGIASG
eukprot:TRINITY_DN7465_c0_g1_i1.p2 TRINITY_DN7465_c0_g1~~TRINITY_DN7465_c0_g1_i1.p2  ORF type:complete len:204 (-),score=36.04 TRINITY_DN7465_c0_g1_i1:221-832(-)